MATRRVVVVGASGFGRESLDVLEAMRRAGMPIEVVGVVDDAPSEMNLRRLHNRGVEYLGTIDSWLASNDDKTQLVLGVGNPQVRKRIVSRISEAGCVAFSAIHPDARIGSNATFGPGVVVCAGATISTNVRLGRHVHINPSATIGHDSVLSEFVSINPSATISGEVCVHPGVLVGAGAVVLQGLTIGEDTTVGAGAVVTKDVPSKVVVKGVPGVWQQPQHGRVCKSLRVGERR